MKAFSLIELIFVIVIMGILTFTGLRFIPDETLTVDTQMLKQLILAKKSNALGYKYTGDSNYTCITLDKDSLNNEYNYTFKSDISVNGLENGNEVCFDYLGRPYDGKVDYNLTNLLHNDINMILKYRNKEKNITLYPITGSIK